MGLLILFVFVILCVLGAFGIIKNKLISDINIQRNTKLSILLITTVVLLYINYLSAGEGFNESSYSLHITTTKEISSTPEKWIVLSSSQYPTPNIQKFASLSDWQVVVVADQDTPEDWSHRNIILLDISTQFGLNYAVLKYLPWNSLSRKMIGFLYAIQNGAKIIYDTQDNVPPPDFDTEFSTSTQTFHGLAYSDNGSEFQNPYFHFSRDLNYTQIQSKDSNNTSGRNYFYTVCEMNAPLIQQQILNEKHIHFDSHAPALVYPSSKFAPINSPNTLFLYDAFWAMFIPSMVNQKGAAENWRGYWAQKLIWEIGGHAGFYPPSLKGNNTEDNSRNWKDSEDMEKAKNLTARLNKWNCSEPEDFYSCMKQLAASMKEWELWTVQEVNLLNSWIKDLKSVKYIPPVRLSTPLITPCTGSSNQSFAIFSPAINIGKNTSSFRKELYNFCNLTMDLNSTEITSVSFPTTLLVIEFNWPIYENIWLFELIYRPHFPNILYCGDAENKSQITDLLSLPTFQAAGVSQFSFAQANVSGGSFGYDCATQAVSMGYRGITGYLLISDDVLLNFWNNINYPQDVVWRAGPDNAFRPSVINLAIYAPQPGDTGQWKSRWGATVTKKAIEGVYEMAKSNPLIAEWVDRRWSYGYNVSIVMVGGSDAYYFPGAAAEMVYHVGRALREQPTWLEMAVQILLSGLSSPNETWIWPATYLWNGKERGDPFGVFNESLGMIHPVKMRSIVADLKYRGKYCDNYIRKVLSLP